MKIGKDVNNPNTNVSSLYRIIQDDKQLKALSSAAVIHYLLTRQPQQLSGDAAWLDETKKPCPQEIIIHVYKQGHPIPHRSITKHVFYSSY